MQRIAHLIQADNEIFHAEIRDKYGAIEAEITAKTAIKVHSWAYEQGCGSIKLEGRI